jgi:hypothetical protein
MKILASSFAALALAGCGTYPEQGQDPESQIQQKMEKLRAEVAQQNALQALTCEKLVDANRGLVERVTQAENLLKVSQAEIKVLQDQVKTLQAQVASGAAAAPDSRPAPAGKVEGPAVPARKIEDILLDIEAAITGLSSGKLKREEAAAQLKPHAAHAAPRLIEEVRGSPTRFEYVKQLEWVLAQLPPRDLKVFLREALTQRGSRDSAARVIGMTKHAGTPDDDFRLLLGDSLVACRNAAGIPPLVQSLKSDQNATRTIAIAALKRVNRGESFGYSAPLSPEQNANAIKSWEEWAQKFGPTIFD